MPDMEKIKKMPGFIAFWGSNVPTATGETQLQDTEKAVQEIKKDQQYADANTNNGGEQGKAE